MPRKRFTTEQIIHKLREAEVELAKGRTIAVVCKQLGITDPSVLSGRDLLAVYWRFLPHEWLRPPPGAARSML